MKLRVIAILSLLGIATSFQLCGSPSRSSSSALTGHPSRRHVFQTLLVGGAAVLANNQPTNALDMDAFMNSELEADTKNCDPKKDPKCIPKLTSDEALCKYGQSGNARAEACKKVKAAGGELPKPGSQGKSLGGAYAI